MPFFRRAKEKEKEPEYVPVELVQKLAAQGLSEAEIISQLRKQGFSSSQIDKALTAAIKSKVGGPQPPVERTPPQTKPPEPVQPQMPQQISPPLPPLPATQQKPPEIQIPQPTPPKEEVEPQITLEELIEGIVAERWEELEEKLKRFEERDKKLQEQVEELRKRVEEVEKLATESKKTLLGKIEEFDEHVAGIEGRVGSIEKAFKDFLPELTENIRTMQELVERMKAREA
ncbi:MAG: hypothetical protein GXO63_02545 [Candidatus Micrarchaeota archaeon]|nr:hypothetical protein [Candidatus Micrarchaeota archaeon]